MAQYFFNPADHATGALSAGVFDLYGSADLSELSIVEDAAYDFGKALRWIVSTKTNRYLALPGVTASNDVEVLICVKPWSGNTAENVAGAACMISDGDNHLRVGISAQTTNATVRQWVNPVSTVAANPSSLGTAATVDWSAGDSLLLRVRSTHNAGLNRNDVFCKRWVKGTSEPGSWHQTTTDVSPFTPAGGGGLYCIGEFIANITSDYQWFSIGTAGDSAPDTPPVSNTPPVVQINLPAAIGAEMMEAISCA